MKTAWSFKKGPRTRSGWERAPSKPPRPHTPPLSSRHAVQHAHPPEVDQGRARHHARAPQVRSFRAACSLLSLDSPQTDLSSLSPLPAPAPTRIAPQPKTQSTPAPTHTAPPTVAQPATTRPTQTKKPRRKKPVVDGVGASASGQRRTRFPTLTNDDVDEQRGRSARGSRRTSWLVLDGGRRGGGIGVGSRTAREGLVGERGSERGRGRRGRTWSASGRTGTDS